MAKVLRYFLGVMSPQGYVFRSDQLGEPGVWRCWVVTGGAAATRSKVIAGARQAMERRCSRVEELLRPADPSALDGAIFPELRVSVADGEPLSGFQDLRPRYPGAYERPVALWDCLDQPALWDRREELIARSRERERLFSDAGGYLYAAGALMGELVSVGAAAMDREKLTAYAQRLAAREFPRPSGKGQGEEKARFLSAVTGKGRVALRDTVAAEVPRIIAIEDDWGAVGGALLEALRELALGSGTEVISCRCPLFPFTKLDHLLLPRLGLGFITLGRAAPELSGLQERTIHAERFADVGQLRQKRARSAFLRKAAAGMLDQAALVFSQAAAAQRGVDEILLSATDPEKVDRVTERVIEEMAK